MGKNVLIGNGTKIGAFCELGNGITIGKNCSVQAFVYIPPNVEIMDNVFIGPRVTFTNDKYAPSIILPNLVIGDNAIIGAGSLVTKSIPPNQMWYGSPARYIKMRF